MSTSTRFAVAIHILTVIELFQGKPVRSESIARSVNTNPTVVRRLLGILTDAGLTKSRMGLGGGALLARPASKISLLDVYRAVEETPFFSMHRDGPSQVCAIGMNITPVLEAEFGKAAEAMERMLSKTTIADTAKKIQESAGDAALKRLIARN